MYLTYMVLKIIKKYEYRIRNGRQFTSDINYTIDKAYPANQTRFDLKLENTVQPGHWLNYFPWAPRMWRYDVWFWANGQVNQISKSFNEDYLADVDGDWMMTKTIEDSMLDTSKADTTGGYNTDTEMKIWVTFTLLFRDINTYNGEDSDVFGDNWRPGHRWFETTKLIIVNKNSNPFTGTTTTYTAKKLLTLEDGQTQCVSIDCSNSNRDCFLLPDC